MRASLLKRQWDGYPRYHQSRANLLIHIAAVPAFEVGNVAMLLGAGLPNWRMLALGAATTVAGIVIQGKGHQVEAVPPEPFAGPADALVRIFCEQWITFPRFVFSGRWVRAFRSQLPL